MCGRSPDSVMLQSLTLLSRLPVARQRPSGAQLMLQMMREWALATFPIRLNGASPAHQDGRDHTMAHGAGSSGGLVQRTGTSGIGLHAGAPCDLRYHCTGYTDRKETIRRPYANP